MIQSLASGHLVAHLIEEGSRRCNVQSFVPPFNHLPLAHCKSERLAAVIGSVELGPIGCQGATVVHADGVATDGFPGAGVLDKVFGLDFGGKGEDREQGGSGGYEGEDTHDCGICGIMRVEIGYSIGSRNVLVREFWRRHRERWSFRS